ncbi:hypothetical protein FisN_7Lh352 [Fistulifera solaris]|uniref:Kinesin motor domain-containing protein n=1 Tax=Fistulifera solaris TaxID=1519565 RepID=A0A1Z5JRU6_FISSO|nr:hypothetical protein FisN_7Lh352 [Fistulifera solaris]|eukprot:GAX16616.1 hypothetical protein FisN_7Lh352 [Fistulifera solaris]
MCSLSDQISQNSSQIPVSVRTVLRVRPFLKRERDDAEVLKPIDTSTVVMGPQPAVQMLSPSSALVKQTIDPENNHDEDFSFDLVLRSTSTQEDMYFAFGSNMAQQAMEPLKASKDHDNIQTSLIISMGLSNSGKTFSCWGDHCLGTQKLPQDGMLPRILDSLFAQSAHFVEKKQGLSFGVEISVVQVGNRDGVINDLLKSSSRRSIRSTISSFSRNRNVDSPFQSHNSVMIEQDPISLECRLKNQQRKLCLSWEDARLALKKAVKIRHNNARPGHVLVQTRPVMVNRSLKVVEKGGMIAILEMESLINGKKIKAGRIKDTIPNRTDAYGSVMQCLRVALDNQNDPNNAKNVPFVQHKVTMLLQSIFLPENTDSIDVTVLVTAYPGDRDYIEKKELLRDMQLLRQKVRTNYVITEMASSKSMKSDFEANCAYDCTSRNQTSRLRKHSNDFSDGGGRKTEKEKALNERKSPEKLSSNVGATKSKKTPDLDVMFKRCDRSGEDIVPLPPPPVAPGYRPRSALFQQNRSEPRLLSPRRMSVCKASAPVEETISFSEANLALVDFPGVVVPKSLMPTKNLKEEQEAGDDEGYISFVEDHGDGYQVREMAPIAFSTCDSVQISGRAFKSRDTLLGKRVEFLSKENEYLRAENESIKRELVYLKQELENRFSMESRWKASNSLRKAHAEENHTFGRYKQPSYLIPFGSGSTRSHTKEPSVSDISNRYP